MVFDKIMADKVSAGTQPATLTVAQEADIDTATHMDRNEQGRSAIDGR